MTRPASATSFWANCVGLVVLFASYAVVRNWDISAQSKVIAVLALTAIPIGLIDLTVFRVHRRATTGLDWDKPFTPSRERVLLKLLGLAVSLGTVAFVYWLLPEYHGAFYDSYYALLRRFALSFAIIAPLYVALIDGHMREPKDVYWRLGRVAMGHYEDASAKEFANLARSWLVKAFFLPLMVKYAHDDIGTILGSHLDFQLNDLRVYDYLYTLGYSIDLVFVTFGYILSFRLFDSHVRSAEPTMFGWVVALFCYQPFYSLMSRQYVSYDGGQGFGDWLAPWPGLRWAWAIGILVLVIIYSLASVAFGWRFSNLTHRGILTGGPYRFTKHPAYVSKNISWWMVSVPFLSHLGAVDAFRRSILLLAINTIYFLRARTEEAHLSRDPVYVQYALWMNEHGLLAFLGRWFPALQYKPPPGWAPAVVVPETRAEAAE